MAFIDEMEAIAARFQTEGYEVTTPVREEASFSWNSLTDSESFELKKNYIDRHLEKIRRSHLVLLANFSKNGIDGYIGANSLMEASFAYALNVPIAYLNPIGEQPCRLEALAISQAIVGEDLGEIAKLMK